MRNYEFYDPYFRVKLNFLGQTAASRRAGFLTFQELTTPQSLGFAGEEGRVVSS